MLTLVGLAGLTDLLAQISPGSNPEAEMAQNPALLVIVLLAAVALVVGILVARKLNEGKRR